MSGKIISNISKVLRPIYPIKSIHSLGMSITKPSFHSLINKKLYQKNYIYHIEKYTQLNSKPLIIDDPHLFDINLIKHRKFSTNSKGNNDDDNDDFILWLITICCALIIMNSS